MRLVLLGACPLPGNQVRDKPSRAAQLSLLLGRPVLGRRRPSTMRVMRPTPLFTLPSLPLTTSRLSESISSSDQGRIREPVAIRTLRPMVHASRSPLTSASADFWLPAPARLSMPKPTGLCDVVRDSDRIVAGWRPIEKVSYEHKIVYVPGLGCFDGEQIGAKRICSQAAIH